MRIDLCLFVVCLLLPTAALADEGKPSVDFNRDILPVFSAKCFACHGPDEAHREAGLRLDQREAPIELGAIVPGDPDASEMISRIFAEDADRRMPPPQANDHLTDEQKSLFRRWVAEGARYEKHWAFTPPQKSQPPAVKQESWPNTFIDHYILARLEEEGLSPAQEADRYTLIRRLYLDLIGIPPTPEEADAYVTSEDPDIYESTVDRLLASPRYGERWARRWLDLARYADTNGYEKDRPRSIWPYRDWVIRALNDDVPFDQFTIEQLAGDMLPDSTESQKIATGFHRNTMLNEEGGIDPLEYRYYALVDRVATTGTVWMGMTIGCAQCHTHKYDPITHTDYYRFMALLNNADEPDMTVRLPDVASQREALEAQIESLQRQLPEQFPPAPGDAPLAERRKLNLEAKFGEWFAQARSTAVDWKPLEPRTMSSNLPRLELLDDGSILSTGDVTRRDVYTLTFHLSDNDLPLSALRLEVLPDPRLPANGPGRAYYEGRQGDFFLSEVRSTMAGKEIAFVNPSHSFGKISVGSGSADAGNVIDGKGSTGWSTSGWEGEAHQLVLNLAEPIRAPGTLQIEMLFERHFAASLGRFRISGASVTGSAVAREMPTEIEQLLARASDPLDDDTRSKLQTFYLQVAPELAEARKEIEQLQKTLPQFPTTLVLQERPADHPRSTHRHHRGEFLSPKEEVQPGIPQFLAEGTKGTPQNRLELARWLASDANPLVARVAANRAWQAFFGRGLVESAGDFGTQSDPPTHPQLLDHLAVAFMEDGWSQKQLHRLIVTSATYKQSSRVELEIWQRDPQNRLFARGPRFRLEGELIRDSMLHASGLLSLKMYGPSVFPPQPESVTALAYGETAWQPSTGEDRYRRSVYTFSKRTAPFAAFAVFDAPTGENCTPQRDRSNTPLQALTLLNDEMFLEMARALAAMAEDTTSTNEDAARLIFRRILTRPPAPAEIDSILTYFDNQRQRIDSGALDGALIAGDKAADKAADSSRAAWVLVARALMNLDEAITKP